MRSLRSEWLALTTTRALLGHAAAAVVVGLLPLLVLPLVSTQPEAAGVPDLTAPSGQLALLSASGTAYLLGAILGAVVASRRHRHRTIVGQLLATPERPRAALAQAAVVVLAGALLGLLAAAVTAAAVGAGLAIVGEPLVVGSATIARIVAGGALAGAVGGAIGNGVGAVVRNAGAAIAGVVVFVFLVDGLVVGFLPEVGQWLPGALLARVEQGAGAAVPGDVAPAVALVVACGQALALVLAGVAATVRRDAV